MAGIRWFQVELINNSILFHVVQEVRAQAEAFVQSKPRQARRGLKNRKRDLNGLGEDLIERLGRLQSCGPNSILGSAMREYESTLELRTGKAGVHIVYDSMVTSSQMSACYRWSREVGHRNCLDNDRPWRYWGMVQQRCSDETINCFTTRTCSSSRLSRAGRA